MRLLKALAISLVFCLPMSVVAQPVLLPMTDFSSMVEAVSGGVVRISIVKKLEADNEALQQYFGGRIPPMPPVENLYGTGFFISKDGYILTNHHVIEGADSISITMNDRTELDAVVVGSDMLSDVAVLKVVGDDFPALDISYDELKVGEPVLAIGSPFGFDYSASAGIVSAKSRNFTKEAAVPFIQSDVALNPGNSGGPLFNKYGKVVGVNSRIFSETGGYMGLSFSIPIDVAMAVYREIKATGKVIRVYLGVGVQDIDRTLAQAYQLDKPKGALLTSIANDSLAQKVGLQRGDLVLSFNDTPIHMASDLLNLINRAKPYDKFYMTVRRDNKDFVIGGVFDEPMQSVSKSQTIKLGISLRQLSIRQAQSLGIKGGVVLTVVDADGLASKAGLMVGDVILRLHKQDIQTVADFEQGVKGLPKTGVVTAHILRQGTPAIIGIRLN